MWSMTSFEGRKGWVGETERLRVTIIPELGSKLVSLVDLGSGREWLSQTERLGGLGYDSSFAEGDLRGWDDMFPSIDACIHPNFPWQGSRVPDHGEVWSIPWQAATAGDELACVVYGVRFPYRLEKRIRFDTPHSFTISYRAENLSPFPFPFLWAAHPLLEAEPGMRIRVPYPSGAEVELTATKHGLLGDYRAKQPWPAAKAPSTGERVALDIVPGRTDRYEKYYFWEPLSEGWAALEHPESGITLRMEFSLDQLPYFAIWANYGGYEGGYHVAFEPATGYLDNLATAVEEDNIAVLPARGIREWSLRTVIS